jgi:transposase
MSFAHAAGGDPIETEVRAHEGPDRSRSPQRFGRRRRGTKIGFGEVEATDVLPLLDEAFVALSGRLFDLPIVRSRTVGHDRSGSEVVCVVFVLGCRLRRCRFLEYGPLLEQVLFQCEREVVEQVPTVCHVCCAGSAFGQSFPVDVRAVAGFVTRFGTVYMAMRDTLGAIFEDEDFAHLFPRRGQPAMAPWRLALVTIMQFAEGLSDRQAADAVRARIDWKYALSLELDDPGFDTSVLSEFRSRLLEGEDERLLFDHLLDRFREMGLVKARGKQRTDSTRILAVVRGLNRLELVGETMRHALDVLATVAPEWLQEHVHEEWTRRYARRPEDGKLPKSKGARQEEAEKIGADGHELLSEILSEASPAWLRQLPAVETLRKVWVQNFFHDQDREVCWRTSEDGIPRSTRYINSPIDPDCRYARKFTTSWVGYRVHFTETCEEGLPNIITDVQTAPLP